MQESPDIRRRRRVLQACGVALAAAAGLPGARARGLGDERIVAFRNTAGGTVVAVDTASRRLTTGGPQGEVTYRVDPRVGELEAVRVGTAIEVDYVAAVGLTLRRGSGELNRDSSQAAGRGLLTGAGAGKPVTTRTRVLAVDRQGLSLRLQGPSNQENDFQVYDRTDLDGVRVGDQVVAVVYEVVAVGIRVAAK